MSAKFTSPFPPLELSYHDERELEGVASRIVDEHAQLFNAYLHQDRGSISPSRWKRLRQRENVHVYQERRSFSRATSDGASELPILLAVGTIVGALDDVMYGVLNPTLASMRLKTSYVEDDLVGAAVLATVTEPSRSEPFHSLTVKWAVKGRGACVRTLVKDRDFVYLESTGIGQLDNGERLGYQLLHSVSFSEVHELSDTLRGNMSMCCVYRQKTHDTVELFMRGYLDPAGAVMRAMVVKSAADVMVSVCNNVYCSEMKKLAWTLQRQKEKTQSVRSRSVVALTMCITCQRRSMPRGSAPSNASICGACCQRVCRSCRIRKKLSFFTKDRRLVQEQVSFCARCLTQAINTSAVVVSCDEIRANDAYTGLRFVRSVTVHSINSTCSLSPEGVSSSSW